MMGPAKRFRAAPTQVRKRLLDAGSELVSLGTKTGFLTPRLQPDDFPGSEDFGAIARRRTPPSADLVDVGQALPLVPVRAEQLARTPYAWQRFRRRYEPEARVAEERRQRRVWFPWWRSENYVAG